MPGALNHICTGTEEGRAGNSGGKTSVGSQTWIQVHAAEYAKQHLMVALSVVSFFFFFFSEEGGRSTHFSSQWGSRRHWRLDLTSPNPEVLETVLNRPCAWSARGLANP